jgi:TM2 domain-containing membrane protein YozV
MDSQRRSIIILLALISTIVPVAGWHKFYLGQWVWGTVYFALSWTPIPRIASAIEAIWYLVNLDERFPTIDRQEPFATINPVTEAATAIRQLEKLRQDGLISEREFEQKRRQCLEKMG